MHTDVIVILYYYREMQFSEKAEIQRNSSGKFVLTIDVRK